MSSVDEKIASYEAEIADIKAGVGLYTDATPKVKRDAIHEILAQQSKDSC